MGDDCHGYGFAILLTSGITCALLLCDLATKYILRKKEDENEKLLLKAQEQTTVAAAIVGSAPQIGGFDFDAITTEDKNLLLGAGTSEVVISKTAASKLGSRPRFIPAEDDETGSEVSRVPSGLSYHLNDLVEALRTNVDMTDIEEDVPGELAEKLREIVSLKDNCNAISCEFDQLSTRLVRPSAREGDNEAEEEQEKDETNSLTEYQKRNAALKCRWNAIRRLFFCADVHLRNATNYQQFYHEVKEVQLNLRHLHDTEVTNAEPKTMSIESAADFEEAVEDYQSLLDTILMWQNIVGDLTEKSLVIVPVHKRTEVLETPIPVSALCTFKKDDIAVVEGENLVLVNNEDQDAWIVRNSEGDEGALPAVCCLIAPPDIAAVNTAAKLKQNFSALAITTETHLRKTLLEITRGILNKMIVNKEDYFEVLKNTQKEKIVDLLTQLRGWMEMSSTEQTLEKKRVLVEHLDQLDKIIQGSSVKGLEYEHLDTEVVHLLIKILDLLGIQEDLQQRQKRFRSMSWNQANEDSLSFDSEWDTLDELDGLQHEKGLGISVQKSTTEVGESSSITSAKGEVRQTFSIKAVLDLRDDSEISMDEAIERGIIDQTRGVYRNLVTSEEYPMPVAMNAGFIIVESTQTKKSKEETQAVGVITVKITRETRPYNIVTVLDPESNTHIPVSEAVEKGIFDAQTGKWKNVVTKLEVSAQDGIDMGYLGVEYSEDDEGTEPEVIERTFAIYGVMDRSANQRIPFKDAIDKGIIDQDAGLYYDSMTKEKINITEAMGKGWVRARVVTDQSEIEEFMSKRLSGSNDSLNSSGSK